MNNSVLGLRPYAVDVSTALEASSVTCATRAYLAKGYGFIDSTTATGTYYFLILNAASLPADGSISALVLPVKISHTNGADTEFEFDFTPDMIPASNGIVWCFSTTRFTKTITGSIGAATIFYKKA